MINIAKHKMMGLDKFRLGYRYGVSSKSFHYFGCDFYYSDFSEFIFYLRGEPDALGGRKLSGYREFFRQGRIQWIFLEF